MPAITWLIVAPVKFRRRKSDPSINGSAARCSTRTKATAKITATISGTTVCGLSHPLGWPWVRAKTRPTIATANRDAPSQSIRRSDPVGFRSGHRGQRQQQGRDRQGHVDQEDQAPAEGREETTESRPDRGEAGRRPGQDPEGETAPLLGPDHRRDGDRGRHQYGRGQSLEDPGGDHPGHVLSRPGQSGGDGEDCGGDHERPAQSDHVRHPATEDQAGSEGKDVGGQDPRRVGQVPAQVEDDVGTGEGYSGLVDQDHAAGQRHSRPGRSTSSWWPAVPSHRHGRDAIQRRLGR